MEKTNPRAAGGFITTMIGIVGNSIQAIRPEWFGNHKWILPLSTALLAAGVLFWLSQIRWIQRLLGLRYISHEQQDTASQPSPAPSPRHRLKIISAHYGIEGISDPEVTPYLEKRQYPNAFAEPIVGDLFDGFDPVPGNPNKRLKVRYSFDSKEATIERPEFAWLILPEDSFLRGQLESLHDGCGRKEKQFNADLWRAQEGRRLCDEERREALKQLKEAKLQLDLFTPLQMKVFELAAALRNFRVELGPKPKIDHAKFPPDSTYEIIRAQAEFAAPWFKKLFHGYAARLTPRMESIMHELGEAGVNVQPLEQYIRVIDEDQLLQASHTLDQIAIELSH